ERLRHERRTRGGRAGDRPRLGAPRARRRRARAARGRGAMSTGPLDGCRVLVTRASEQALDLSERLRSIGATVIEAPAIRLVDPPDWQPLDRALEHLSAYDWIVFTSQNAVPRLLARLRARGVPVAALATSRHAAIGEATAEALRTNRLRIDLVADEYRAESVAEALAAEPLA